jgi:hypothetical protein
VRYLSDEVFKRFLYESILLILKLCQITLLFGGLDMTGRFDGLRTFFPKKGGRGVQTCSDHQLTTMKGMTRRAA